MGANRTNFRCSRCEFLSWHGDTTPTSRDKHRALTLLLLLLCFKPGSRSPPLWSELGARNSAGTRRACQKTVPRSRTVAGKCENRTGLLLCPVVNRPPRTPVLLSDHSNRFPRPPVSCHETRISLSTCRGILVQPIRKIPLLTLASRHCITSYQTTFRVRCCCYRFGRRLVAGDSQITQQQAQPFSFHSRSLPLSLEEGAFSFSPSKLESRARWSERFALHTHSHFSKSMLLITLVIMLLIIFPSRCRFKKECRYVDEIREARQTA